MRFTLTIDTQDRQDLAKMLRYAANRVERTALTQEHDSYDDQTYQWAITPDQDPSTRLALVMCPGMILDALQNSPREALQGIPTFSKQQLAQAHRDQKRLNTLYNQHGGFIRGIVHSRLIYVRNVLKPETKP